MGLGKTAHISRCIALISVQPFSPHHYNSLKSFIGKIGTLIAGIICHEKL